MSEPSLPDSLPEMSNLCSNSRGAETDSIITALPRKESASYLVLQIAT